MPTLGAKNGLTLASMIGKDFDDPEWDTLLDQLTYSEMVQTITLGFHNTAAAAVHRQDCYQGRERPSGSDRCPDRWCIRNVLHLRGCHGCYLQC